MTNDTTIRIALVLMPLADWTARIYDVKGEFLKGQFEDGKRYGMPQLGFGSTEATQTYIHELKQAVLLFWQKLL